MEERKAKTAALIEVNEEILNVAAKSVSQGEEWEFFCECGGEGCNERVSLTLPKYSDLHDRGGLVLARGHRGTRARRARRVH